MISKGEYKKALKEKRIYTVGTKYTRNGWTHFSVFILRKGGYGLGLYPVVVEESLYWNKKTSDYACVAWGTNRVLEIILNIGYTLGLKFDEIKQNYGLLN